MNTKDPYDNFHMGFLCGFGTALIVVIFVVVLSGCSTAPKTPPAPTMAKAVAVKRAPARLDLFGPTPLPARTLRPASKAATVTTNSLPYRSNVTLIWDPSADATVNGYNLYYGSATGNYTNVIDAGFQTNATAMNLYRGKTYYFAATACVRTGTNLLESPFSNEVAYLVPAPMTNNAIALTAQGSDNPGGPWVDLGISWVFPNTAGSQFFRLRIEGTNMPGWPSPSATILTPK